MKKFTKFLAIILVAVLAISVVPAQAEAKSAKKVTGNVNYQKAGKLSTGLNTVTCKKNSSYFCFKAPATAKYTFTFSDIVSIGNKKSTGLANVHVYERKVAGKNSYFTYRKVSTEGGKEGCLRMASKNYDTKYLSGKGTQQYRKTRSAKKVALKKGEYIWFNFYYTAQSGKLNVKVEKIKK